MGATYKTAVNTAVFNTGTDYATAAAVKTAFDNAVVTQKAIETAVAAVNAATSATDAATALTNPANATALNITLTGDYAGLSVPGKTAVATTVWNTGTDYATAAAIKTIFEAAVATQKATETAEAALNAITAPLTPTTANFVLPGFSNTLAVTWSSDKTAIAVSGTNATVARPAFAAGDTNVKLTASVTVGSVTKTKEFTVVVTKQAASNVATLAANAPKYTLAGAAGSETITLVDINLTTVTLLKAQLNLTASTATIGFFGSDGITPLADTETIVPGQKIIITAQDGTTKTTYTVAS